MIRQTTPQAARPARRHWLWATAWLLAGLLPWRTPASAEPGDSSAIGAARIAVLIKRFGPDAAVRITRWQGVLQALKHSRPGAAPAPERQLLDTVNDYFNRNMAFVDDLGHWDEEDYWATPAEFVASGGGDCEDYVLAKYYALKELGLPASRLRITYVRSTRSMRPHMVLAYHPAPGADPLVLDNLEPSILPAAQRPDLMPIYGFNDDALWLARDGVSAPTGGAGQVRRWRALQDKLRHEQAP